MENMIRFRCPFCQCLEGELNHIDHVVYVLTDDILWATCPECGKEFGVTMYVGETQYDLT